jgi:anti-sigma regulatory factor (Ser/Thr protein kinase)
MNIKLKVNIKDDRMSDGLLAAIDTIHLINEATDENITLDFSDVKFITPLYVLPLVVFLNSCNKNITIVNMNEYLQTIGFAKGMCPDKMRKSEFIAIMEKYSQKTYIPIVSFPATKDSDDEKDAILSTVESIIMRQLNLDSNISTGLKYMLGESIDNIIQHAQSERGYIFAQSYPNKKFLDICIADSGITLLGSYQTLPDNEIESDLEAIQAANRGISTKNLPNAENRGYGIITSKKMLIDGLDGSFIMMSGNALHLYNSEHQKFIETPSSIRWDGTIIALRMPYLNKDFHYINYIE